MHCIHCRRVNEACFTGPQPLFHVLEFIEIPGFVIRLYQERACIRSTDLSYALQANWTSIIFHLEKHWVIANLGERIIP